jgi:hypothetical protein
MRLLQLLLLIALCTFTAARNLPNSVPRFANISSIATGVEQTDQPIDWLEFNTGVDPPPAGTKPFDPKEQAIWCKAVNRGRMFVNAMKLNEEDATKLLGWPHVQSKWDGTLHEELIKWGYRDDDEQHKKVDARCRFSDYSRVFYDLKISEKSAKEGGPNRCFIFAHKSGPAMELDAKGQMPKVDKQTYVVDGVKYPVSPHTFMPDEVHVLIYLPTGHRRCLGHGGQPRLRRGVFHRPHQPRNRPAAYGPRQVQPQPAAAAAFEL